MVLREIGLDLSGSEQVTVSKSSEHGNEHCDSIKGGKVFHYLSDCELPNRDAIPWSWMDGLVRESFSIH